MAKRPPIPAELERAVLVEAGHRCAIPTCRQVPVEIAHIIPWARCKEHRFENLIALCPTCHTRFDRGEIDRKAMFIYKQKLAFLNSRYGDFEQRVIRYFARNQGVQELWLMSDLEILLWYLLEDGLLADTGRSRRVGNAEEPVQRLYALTEAGRRFIQTWLQPEKAE